MDKKGVIYILTNPSFPDYVKIGYANDLEQRMKELNSSEALPYAFRVYAVYEVNKRLTDKKLHELIDKLNPDLRAVEEFDGKPRKWEFYAISKEDAYDLLDCIAKISGTENRLKRMKPTGHEELDEKLAEEIEREAREKRGPLKLTDHCGIKPGDFVVFRDDPSIKVEVYDNRKLRYEGKIYSFTALAEKLTGKKGLAGTDYFMYDGMILPELRKKREREKEQD